MKCDNCKKNAVVNVQKVWIVWKYDHKTDMYSDDHDLLLDVEEPTGEENLHFCEKCFSIWKKEYNTYEE